jgi:hypothetical protein
MTETVDTTQNSESTESGSEFSKGLEYSLDFTADSIKSSGPDKAHVIEVSDENLGDLVKNAIRHNSLRVGERGLEFQPEAAEVKSDRLLARVDVAGSARLVEPGRNEATNNAHLHLILDNNSETPGMIRSTLGRESTVENFDTRNQNIINETFEGAKVGEGINGYLERQMRERGVSLDETSLTITEQGNLRVEVSGSAEVELPERDPRDILKDACVTTLNENPMILGNVGAMYLAVQRSKENIDRPGESNKLLSSLQAIDKEYIPKVESEDEIVSELIKKADSLAEELADKSVHEYSERKTSFDTAHTELEKELESEDLDLARIRNVKHALEQERDELTHTIQRTARKLGNREVGEEAAAHFDLKELGEDVTYEPEDEPSDPIEKIDVEIAFKREKLKDLTDVSAGQLSNYVREIRMLGVERRVVEANAEADEAEQRVEKADDDWSKAREELGKRLSNIPQNGVRGVVNGVNDFINATGERVGSRVNRLRTEFRRDMQPVVDRASEFTARGAEAVNTITQRADEFFLGGIRNGIRTTREGIADTTEWAEGEWNNRIRSRHERMGVIRRKYYYNAIHELGMWRSRSLARIESGIGQRLELAGLGLGELIGGEAQRERNRQVSRREQIQNIYSDNFNQRVEEINASDNPRMSAFQRDLAQRVEIIKETAPATEPATEDVSKGEDDSEPIDEGTQEIVSEKEKSSDEAVGGTTSSQEVVQESYEQRKASEDEKIRESELNKKKLLKEEMNRIDEGVELAMKDAMDARRSGEDDGKVIAFQDIWLEWMDEFTRGEDEKISGDYTKESDEIPKAFFERQLEKEKDNLEIPEEQGKRIKKLQRECGDIRRRIRYNSDTKYREEASYRNYEIFKELSSIYIQARGLEEVEDKT